MEQQRLHFLLVCAVALGAPVPALAQVVRHIDFEDAHVSQNGFLHEDGYEHYLSRTGQPPNPSITTAQAVGGTQSIVYRAGSHERAEHKYFRIDLDRQYYVGFSVFIPDEFEKPQNSKIFWQGWQGPPFGPPVHLKFRPTSSSNPAVRTVFWVHNPDDGPSAPPDPIVPMDRRLDREQWHRFVVYLKPRYEDQKGQVALWLNGEQICDLNVDFAYDPNVVDPQAGKRPHDFLTVKMGLYQNNSNSHSALYFDDIVLAKTFEEAESGIPSSGP